MNGIRVFNKTIEDNLIKNGKFLDGRTSYIPAYAQIFINIKRSEEMRAGIFKEKGLTVPPILIISVTNYCNLNCAGCYANSQNRKA